MQLWWENLSVLMEKAGKFSSLAERREEGGVDPRTGVHVKKRAVGMTVKVCSRRTWEARKSRSPRSH